MNLIEVAKQEQARIEEERANKSARLQARIDDEKRRAAHVKDIFNDVLNTLELVREFGIGRSSLKSVDYAFIVIDEHDRSFEIHYDDAILKDCPNWGGGLYRVCHGNTYSVPGSPEDVVKWLVRWLEDV